MKQLTTSWRILWVLSLQSLIKWAEDLIVDIKDNGQGLQRGRGFGLGMVSMQERAKRIDAELSFISMYNGLHVQIKKTLQ